MSPLGGDPRASPSSSRRLGRPSRSVLNWPGANATHDQQAPARHVSPLRGPVPRRGAGGKKGSYSQSSGLRAAYAAALRGGWLHTGDMGAFDSDGYLTLKDRSKDMIISGGSNIYPREIEEILLRHPDVAECAVVGRPHEDWGEEVVAFIVAKSGADVREADLDSLCLQHIARFKRPKAYRMIDALPKNNYGKILKTELRDLS